MTADFADHADSFLIREIGEIRGQIQELGSEWFDRPVGRQPDRSQRP
jgi:hypothetical protein